MVRFLGVTRLECRKSVPTLQKKELERTLHVAILTIKSVVILNGSGSCRLIDSDRNVPIKTYITGRLIGV